MKKLLLLILSMALLQVSLFASDLKDDKITLRFTNAELRGVLEVLERTTPYNIMFPDDIKGKVTIKMKDLKLEEALDRVFRGQRYHYLMDGKNVIVYKKGSAKPIQFTFKLQHIRVEDVEALLKGLMGTNETYSASPALNTVSLKASVQTVLHAKRMIAAIDLPPKQILMKAKILEIKREDGDTDQKSSFGMDLSYTSSSPQGTVQNLSNGLAASPPETGFYAQVMSGNLSAYLSAISRVGDYELLASPWITAVNHHKAELLIGSKYGYKTILVSDTGTQENIDFLEVGIKLIFTPHISDDGYIRMSLQPSISDGKIVDGLPQENTTETNNDVLVKDGETLVIGGLSKLSESEIHTGIPILNSLPFIGGFFGKVETHVEKRELMVIITPTIITPEHLGELKMDSEDMERRVLDQSIDNAIFGEGDGIIWEEEEGEF